MSAMPMDWRYRWCESGACGCLGCANASGGVGAAGYSKQDWEGWVTDNPNPTSNNPQPYIHHDLQNYLILNGELNVCKDETNS